jgi:hypothetical protein
VESERNSGVLGIYPNVSWRKSEVARFTESAEMVCYFRPDSYGFGGLGLPRRM